MEKKIFDLSKTTLGSNGSVHHSNPAIIELDEKELNDVHGGFGGDESPDPWTNNGNCSNVLLACESNTRSCVNVLSCGDTTNDGRCTNANKC